MDTEFKVGQEVILLGSASPPRFRVGETYIVKNVYEKLASVCLEDHLGYTYVVAMKNIVGDYDINEYATEHDGRGRRRDDMMPPKASYAESRVMVRRALEARGIAPIDRALREYESQSARRASEEALRQCVDKYKSGEIVYYHTGGTIAKVFSKMPNEVGIKVRGSHLWVSPDEISKPVALEPIAKGERAYAGEYVKCYVTTSNMFDPQRYSGRVVSRKERFLRSDIYLVELTDGTTSEFTEDQIVERYVFAVEPRVLAEAKLPVPHDTKEEKRMSPKYDVLADKHGKVDDKLYDLLGGESAKHSWAATIIFNNGDTSKVAVVTNTLAIHEASLAITDAFVEREGMTHGTDFYVRSIEYQGKVAAI